MKELTILRSELPVASISSIYYYEYIFRYEDKEDIYYLLTIAQATYIKEYIGYKSKRI